MHNIKVAYFQQRGAYKKLIKYKRCSEYHRLLYQAILGRLLCLLGSEEVLNALRKLKKGKGLGPDEIPFEAWLAREVVKKVEHLKYFGSW